MEAETKTEKKTLSQVIEEHPRTVFWTRFVVWAILACGLPFSFIAYRFNLFRVVSKIQIGGWGIIAILIVAVFAFSVFRYIKLAFSNRYSMTAQCLTGICKVIIPLVALYACLYSIRQNVDLFLQALGCVILCEFAAIPINPLPKWAYEMQKDVRVEERKETVDYLLDGFFSRKNGDKNGN